LDDLIVLAGLVFVRTFLSISLGVEINGHWPWPLALGGHAHGQGHGPRTFLTAGLTRPAHPPGD